jgi:hypothetical protein
MFKKQAASSKTKQEILGPGNSKAKSEPSQSSPSHESIQPPLLKKTKQESPPPSPVKIVDSDERVEDTRVTPTSPKNTDTPFPSSPIFESKAESSPKKKRKAPYRTGVTSSPTKKPKMVRIASCDELDNGNDACTVIRIIFC